MPLLICDNCGCVDNTATCGPSMDNDIKEINLCSECNTGSWHGQFAKQQATEAEIIMGEQLSGYERGKFTFHPLWNIYAQDKENFDIEALKAYKIDHGGTVQYHLTKAFDDNDWWTGGVTAPQVRAKPKIGRNEPCTCGSGKKYKKCCGSAMARGAA